MVSRYDIEDIALLFAERERDGLSIAELSRRTGITRKTLHRWEQKLSEPSPEGAGPMFTEAVIGDVARDQTTGAVSIQIGRATVTIPDTGVRSSVLETIVEVLSARC